MLEFLLPYVDPGFLVVQAAFAAVLVSTIRAQFKERASTVTLLTSTTFFVGLLWLMAFQIALGLPLAATSAFVSALLWAVVAWQRFRYG